MTSVEELNRTILLCRDYVANGLRDEEICQRFQSLQVLCVSDSTNLAHHSGQTALVTLVALLSRMGMQVALSIPDVTMLAYQPPLSGSLIRESLTAFGNNLISGTSVRCDRISNPDIIFVIGDTKIDSDPAAAWRLSGNAWSGVLRLEGRTETRPWASEWPIGSMVSAALAANEAFKFVMRSLPIRNEADQVFFEASRLCKWSFDSIPTFEEGVNVGHVDIISAGAICQACLYALARLPKVEMWGRIFDDDLTAASNLNRNMLSLASDVGAQKALVVAQRCAPTIQLEGLKWGD